MQCVAWIVYNFTKQLIVTLLQQLDKFWEVGWAEAASLTAAQERIYSLSYFIGSYSMFVLTFVPHEWPDVGGIRDLTGFPD